MPTGGGGATGFGLGAPIATGQGKARRSWVLRIVLIYPRKAYSEAVSRQDTETFLRCLENGLRSFGGSPPDMPEPFRQWVLEDRFAAKPNIV
jgi:hypothetical protein